MGRHIEHNYYEYRASNGQPEKDSIDNPHVAYVKFDHKAIGGVKLYFATIDERQWHEFANTR